MLFRMIHAIVGMEEELGLAGIYLDPSRGSQVSHGNSVNKGKKLSDGFSVKRKAHSFLSINEGPTAERSVTFG